MAYHVIEGKVVGKNGENGKLVPQVIAEKNDGKKYGELMFYNSYNKRNI